METAALIPCRTGSKGIPNKNFRELKGKPLWKWSYDAALKSSIFDKIILSSDGGFNFVSDDHKVIVDNERPADLSNDDATLDSLLVYYALKYPDVNTWVLLQPTSPMRTYKDIQKAHKMILSGKYDSVVSVTPGTCMYWLKNVVEAHGKKQHVATYHIHSRPNRQERMKNWFQENGAIYVTNRYILEFTNCRLGGQIGLYSMPRKASLEIDDELDWKLVEMVR
jgi:CMP-N-acetylneuraminic acid synthetase